MSTPNLPLGIVPGMPSAPYHADPGLSNTMLSDLAKSPAHCFALHLSPTRPPRETTDAMRAGQLAHCAILEPQEIIKRYVVKPPGMRFSTKEGMAWRDAQTLEIVSETALDTAGAQSHAIRQVAALRNLLRTGQPEVSVFWTDKATGVRCRARPDWLHWHGPKSVTVVDVKTISELTPESVERAIANYGYHRQAAHYSDGLRACGVHVEEFVFGFVSSSYPFLAVAYLLDDESLQQGVDEVSELRTKFADCSRLGQWPAFGDGYQLISLPKWARRSNELEVGYVENSHA